MLVDLAADATGVVERAGHAIVWQEFGAGDETLLLLPTWSIVHSDFWRHQVPVLARRYRVITFDGLGNGASGRPTDPRCYGDLLFAEDGVSVLDACGVARATVMGVSQGGPWALALAGRHPERVSAAVFIAANVPLSPGHPGRVSASEQFAEILTDHDGWAKWNRDYWLSNYPDFLRFFFSQCFTEPHSERNIDHFVGMGLQTSPEVLLATAGTEEHELTSEQAAHYARRLACPSLVIHGDEDAITPLGRT